MVSHPNEVMTINYSRKKETFCIYLHLISLFVCVKLFLTVCVCVSVCAITTISLWLKVGKCSRAASRYSREASQREHGDNNNSNNK